MAAENKVLNDMNSNTYNASADELKGERCDPFGLAAFFGGTGHFCYRKKHHVSGKNKDTDIIETKNGTIKPWMIQYNGGEYVYTDYIPDLVTNLNVDLQDGAMRYEGNISGTADVEGSVATVTNALPDENIAVLQAGMIRGNVANPDGTPYAATGMLSTTGTVEGNTLTVTAYSANNLGELTAEQADTYDAMARMQKKLVGDAQRNEMRNLYSLSPSTAKYALTEIGSSGSEKMAALTLQSTLTSRVISDRLSTAFSLRPVE